METGCPLPLGGILASRRLDDRTIAAVQEVIRDSLLFALADPAAALPTMRAHAREQEDDVIMRHVELYVNEWTVDLGAVGRRALDELSARAAAVGLCSSAGASGRLEVFSG
jgi:1,4-dihydroxy-6-naphthoate synthase